MDYATIAAGDLKISRICLGGNSWGAAGRRAWSPFGPQESTPFFRRALDLGVNFFDTADVYNAGESEKIIGEHLLPMVNRRDIVLCTKVGMPLSAAARGGLGRVHIAASIDASLSRLKTDYVDLYLMHQVDPTTPLQETLDAMAALVRTGKVSHIGVSNHPAAALQQILSLAASAGSPRPAVLQNLYNLVQREDEQDVAPLCRENGIALTPYSALARGFLAGNRGGPGATERAEQDKSALKPEIRDSDLRVLTALSKIAADHGCTPTQIALAWLWAKGVAAPVLGVTRLEQIDEAAVARDLQLSPADIAALEANYLWRAGKVG